MTALHSARPGCAVFRVVLRDTKGHDAFDVREFDLPLDSSKFPIGRASSNSLKRNLAPASTNAFIDSPVVSRQHATLFANFSSGTPQVYISDCSSMHGTMVNGTALKPGKPCMLKTGDELQFGVDVNRNDEYFVARTYSFQAQQAPIYSLGFTVPDADSDEDEVEAVERQGSQMNPLTIDDSDTASDMIRDDLIDATMTKEAGSPVGAVENVPAVNILAEDDAALQPAITVVQDSFDEEEDDDDIQVLSSDNDVAEEHDSDHMDMDSNISCASSMDEPDYPSSEEEVPDSEGEEDEQHIYGHPPATNFFTEPFLDETALPTDDHHKIATPELPSFDIVFNQAPPFQQPPRDPFDAMEYAPPLPPRPMPQMPQQGPNAWIEDFPATSYDPLHDLNVSPAAPRLYVYDGNHPVLESFPFGASQQANRLQTPPPMPANDTTNSSVLQQPARRTKVSIGEIVSVEDIIEEHPPTPTSVNDLKRKAEILEEESVPALQLVQVTGSTTVPVQAPSGALVAAPVSAATQAADAIAQRPKKQPRSILKRIGQTAKYPLLGAAGAVAAFTFLATAPESFFAA